MSWFNTEVGMVENNGAVRDAGPLAATPSQMSISFAAFRGHGSGEVQEDEEDEDLGG